MTKENHDDDAQAHLASLKRDMRKTLEDAAVRATHKVIAEFEAKSDERLMEMPEKQDEFVVPGGGYVPAIPLPKPTTWHHPDCEGECIACLIEREVEAAYGTQGLSYLRRHIAVTKPLKPWVNLTDEEMHACWDSPLTPLGMKHVRMIEAKLKEKNK